ncbi:MAG: DAK2 domain-containing protein [Anaerolinea sp.]|nr:DAK2 domain-containing protein [Anaerolinea sp.]
MITRQSFRANRNLIVDGLLIKDLFGASLAWLEQNREQVNRLNVFPVPDGDTGTNMYLTMQSAYREVANMKDNHVGKLSAAVATGAIKGARGNSGVILSQLWAGVAKALKDHDTLDAELLAEASRSAVDMAYRAVEKPVEGTILTVSRHMMESVVERYETAPDLIWLLKKMVFAGRESLRSTPEMLPVLKKAGVVDSGGQGLVYIFEGMLRALCGKMLDAPTPTTSVHAVAAMPVAPVATASYDADHWEEALEPEDVEGYGYDVQFLMRGTNLSADLMRAALAEMGGWSTLVVGDENLLKVHVHVHDPGQPISYAIRTGAAIDDVVVENMQLQYEHYVEARKARENEVRTDIEGIAVVTVAVGEGLSRIFYDSGAAYVIHGGQTMNPSTGDFLDAINALPNHEIILLPNNKNIMLAAQQAAQHANADAEGKHKHVRVVPSLTLPQGISAMFEYSNLSLSDANLKDFVEGMTAALDYVQTCEITRATRDVELDHVIVRQGQYIGLLNDQLVVANDDIHAAAEQVLDQAGADKYERITVYYGDELREADAQRLVTYLRQRYSRQDFEVVNGGQALYPYIISVE